VQTIRAPEFDSETPAPLPERHLISEPTAKLLADKGIWWSLQPFLDDEDASPLVNPVPQKKALQVFAGTDNVYNLAKKYKVKTAFGADILFDAKVASRQVAQLVHAGRSAQDGHPGQWRADGPLPAYQSLSRQAGRD